MLPVKTCIKMIHLIYINLENDILSQNVSCVSEFDPALPGQGNIGVEWKRRVRSGCPG